MPIQKDRLDHALATFFEGTDGLYQSFSFINLLGDVRVNFSRIPNAGLLTSNLNFLSQDYVLLETLIYRLHEQKDAHSKGNLDQILWMLYGACDVELFHITLRSLFDYLARAIRATSPKSGQIPESFEELSNFIRGGKTNASKVSEELANFVLSCDWFTDLRLYRTTIVHGGGDTIVFPMPDRIAFQILSGTRNAIFIPELMINENIVDFELYAGMLLGYLIAYLDDFGRILIPQLKLSSPRIGDARHSHFGLSVSKSWIQKVQNIA